MKKSLPGEISGILTHLAERNRWGPRIARSKIWKVWERVVGPQVAAHAWPVRFRQRDILVVAVSDSLWMQQLSYQRDLFLKELNAFLPPDAWLKDIQFEMGNPERARLAWRSARKRNAGRMDRPLVHPPDDIIAYADSIVGEVRDKELRGVMKDLYLRCWQKKKR